MARTLAYPLRILPGGRAAEVEQNTPAEITQCCHVIARHTRGQRFEDPTFGIGDATFTTGGGIEADIAASITRIEPRAKPGVTVDLIDITTAITATVEA